MIVTEGVSRNRNANASLISGVLALLICWLPVINFLSLSLSVPGLFFGFVGLIIALARSGYGVRYAITGFCVSGLAMIIAIVTFFGMVEGWGPVELIWVGVGVNSMLCAAILLGVIPGPSALRRVVRIKRGLCPACAYPRGESDVCSECGKALPTS